MNLNPAEPDPLSFGIPDLSSLGKSAALADILQNLCLTQQTGVINFSAPEGTGYVYIHHGQPVHAITDNNLEGEPAVFQMLQWSVGGYNFDPKGVPQKRTISRAWDQLLFEGALRADGTLPAEATSDLRPDDPKSSQVIRTRIEGGQPKLSVVQTAGLDISQFELNKEFIHVGRVEGNDIVLPAPSVSSRHCMFIIRGADILIRDLNSANGTLVNGQLITEKVLLLGDTIQIGEVVMKLESSIKRPKLRSPVAALTQSGNLTVTPKAIGGSAPEQAKPDDARYVSGGSPIVYTNLRGEAPKPPQKTSGRLNLVIIVGLIVIIGAVAAYAYLTYVVGR
jgi:pSer/pThr/pTyr-binding forkhead associated (FHA) protein